MKNIVIIICLLASSLCFGQKTSPEEIEYYKEAATSATVLVIESADALKAFKASPQFNDIWTSPPVLMEYEEYVTSYSIMLKTVHDSLLSTATNLLELSQYEIRAAKDGMKYRKPGY